MKTATDARLLTDELCHLWNLCNESAKEFSTKATVRFMRVDCLDQTELSCDTPYAEQVSNIDKWAVAELNEMLPEGDDRFLALLKSSKSAESDKAVRYAFALLAVISL